METKTLKLSQPIFSVFHSNTFGSGSSIEYNIRVEADTGNQAVIRITVNSRTGFGGSSRNHTVTVPDGAAVYALARSADETKNYGPMLDYFMERCQGPSDESTMEEIIRVMGY